MQQRSQAHGSAMSRGGGQSWYSKLGALALLAVLFVLPKAAWAANECPDMAITVASGGSLTFQVPSCSQFGANNTGTAGIAQQPSHGTASVDSSDYYITYKNDGLGTSTSDHFAWFDDKAEAIGVTVTIGSGAPTPITLSPTTAPNGSMGQSYSLQFSAAGGNGGPYTYIISQGNLPVGLSDNSTGLISGTPTESGTFTFTETATDSNSVAGSQVITLTITGGAISVAPSSGSLPNATVYQAYSQTLTASGGTAPYTFSQVSGTAPPTGMSIGSGGTISGTATALGTTSFSVKAQDSAGVSTQVNYTVQVVVPTITLSPTSLPSAMQNAAYTAQTITASGGSGPYTFAISSGALPSGMTLSSSGTLSGTPSVSGSFPFTVQATDTHAFTGSANYTLTVNALTAPGAPTGVSATAGDAQATVAFSAPASNGGTAITGYTVISSPAGGVDSNAGSTTLSHAITGLTNGTAYTFTVTATNAIGTGPASTASNSVTPKASQTITFNNPGTQNFGTSPTLTATASSGLAVTFGSNTTGVCTVTSGGALTFVTAGTCTIKADQAGNGVYAAASTVAQSFTVAAVVPGAPTIGTATAGDTQVSVSFTPPSSTGGTSITSYTATSSPGGLTGTCASSPCVLTGLTNGTAYTFTVTATNSTGTGAASAASNSATPVASQTITFSNPGTQNFGTSPTLTATATSSLAVTFTSSTTGVCTVTSGGALTFVTAGTCTINANQAGDSAYQPAPQVSQSFAIAAVVPGAPTIGTATAGDTQVSVSFTPPPSTGGTSITGYTATSSPGGITGTCASSPCVLTGLTNGTAYTFTVTATNSAGTGAASAASNSATPAAGQTITFSNPGTQNFGTSPTLTATATSGLAVTFTSSTTGVCTITSGGALTTVSAGTCTIDANQAGNAAYQPAPQISQSFTIAAVVPGAPAIGTATASSGQAAVAFTPPLFTGGVSITGYTATSSPGGITGTCASSPCTVTGLTNGTAYTFTVTATNSTGTGAASAASNSVTPVGGQTIAFSNPGSQNFGTSPTLGAVASSGLPVSFSSATTAVCTITSGGALTTVTVGSCTINADQSGNGTYAAAPQVSQTFAIVAVVPGAPIIGTATASGGQAAVSFTPPSFIGGAAISGYTVTSSPGGITATGSSSPITVTGLTNGTTYTFTVTATNSAGTGAASAASNSVTPKASGTITNFIAAPSAPVYSPGGTFTVSATSDGSSSPVVFAIDPASAAVCTISGSTVTMLSAGTCTVTANQAGDASHLAAPQVTLAVVIVNPAIPTVGNVSASTAYNTAATINLASAISGASISAINVATQPAHGTVSVSGETVTYTPSASFYGGSDSFTYTATNPGGTSVPATVTVTVGAPAIPTVAAKNAATPYNTAVNIDLSGSITGVDITAVTVATQPAHGTVSVSGQTVTYTPSSTFYGGSDSFTYTATNPGGTSTPATVTVTVTSLNVPVAGALSVTTTTGTQVTIQATTGTVGPQPLTGVSVASPPAHGSASASGTQIVYTPAAGFVGTDAFTYQVANHFGSSQPATITVTVTAAGSASGKSKTVTTTPTAPVSVDLSSIVPGSYVSSAVLGLSPGNAGSVTISQPTLLTFTPSGSYRGLVQITAVLIAAGGQTTTVDVLVLVSSQPDPSKNPTALGVINAQTVAAQRFAQSQLDNVRQRLEGLHDGSTELFSSSLALSLDGKPLSAAGRSNNGFGRPRAPGSDGANGWSDPLRPGIGAAGGMGEVAPFGRSMDDDAPPPSAAPAKPNPSGLGVWINGRADFGSFEAYRQAASFDSDNIAVNMGIDQRIGERGVLGFSLGYDHDHSDIANDGTRSIAQGYSASFYGSFQPTAQVYLDAVLGGGGLHFDSRRHDADSSTFLGGRRSGSQWFGSLTAGYEYRRGELLMSPYGRLEWSRTELNGFSENGVASAALAYGSETVRTSLAVVGLRASGAIKLDYGMLVPRARLEIGHDFQGTSSTTLSYAAIPSAGSWNVLTNPYAANGTSVLLGIGADLQLRDDLLIITDYSYLMQPRSRDQMIRLGLRKSF
ncbi:MAG: autotransporter domain-containing protein [Pseudomonadota bacterium]